MSKIKFQECSRQQYLSTTRQGCKITIKINSKMYSKNLKMCIVVLFQKIKTNMTKF